MFMLKRNVFLLATCAALVPFIGCQSLSDQDQQTFDSALAALEAKNWATAEASLSQFLEANVKFVPAYLARAEARFELRRYPESVEDLDLCLSSGDLSEDESFRALIFKGRCVVEATRQTKSERAGGEDSATISSRRAARTAFIRANAIFAKASEFFPHRYDGLLWRAYCYYRVENYRKAIDLLRLCERAKPKRWEHRFFKALALEGIYTINSESLTTYFEIARVGNDRDYTPVYEHLVSIFPNVGRKSQRIIFQQVEQFSNSVTGAPAHLSEFVKEKRSFVEREEREEKFAAVLEKAQGLAKRSRFQDAAKLVETFISDVGETDSTTQALQEFRERWSMRVETEAVKLGNSERREELEKALEKYRLAQKLTTRIDRLGTLQQRIDALDLVVTRHATSNTLRKAFERLRKGEYETSLKMLRGVSVQSLQGEDKELYFYLTGVANFRLRRWRVAAQSFDEVSQREFQDLDLVHGLALVRSGDENRGVRLLVELPDESRDDEVNRLLGKNFSHQSDLEKAAHYLEKIAKPEQGDYESLAKAYESLGRTAYDNEEYDRAIENFAAARDILEKRLERKAVDVYLRLGNSYFHSEDFDRAKKTYEDLSNTRLTPTEQRRCRELFLYRAQIHLTDRQPDLAYADLAQFVSLGGEIPSGSIHRRYQWLLATYADFAPLDRIHYWTYMDLDTGKTTRLLVKEKTGDEYVVERYEDQTVSSERWSKDAVFLTKRVGQDEWRIPINLEPAKETFPSTAYQREDDGITFEYKAEIQSNNETVEVPGKKPILNCLKVRLKRTRIEPGKSPSFLVYILHLAPGIGEVQRQVKLDGVDVSTIVLSSFAYKSDTLGN